MKLLLLLLSAMVVAATVVVAVPVDAGDGVDNLVQGADVPSDVDNLVEDFSDKAPFLDEKPTVDVTDLINDMRQLHESASDVIQRVEATLSTLESLMPHSIRKRQTTIDGSVYGGPGGTTGRIDVNHKNGGTTYNGNISHGPGGTSYGGGLTHQNGNTNFGANVNKGPGGTSYDATYGKTWNNGRTSVGANVGRSHWGGTSGGISFTHKF
ncbi:hypothetical protein EGW08_004898 [Elysia chlorotica]|uniref:Attacin C-terminal domain-containing protein n=1 Tax=Elysia chlorotica TaxID=188477 RepID=A0A433U0L8_ELYCH|nr:hypothetical protein EGW08_004898 [Elysia chlorotica]